MDNSEASAPSKPAEETPPVTAPDIEAQSSSTAGVKSIVRRWKRDDLLKKGSLVLRASTFLFSFLSFVIMASNKHGDWKNFDRYEEYRYLLAIAILSTLYTVGQVLRQIHFFSTGKQLLSQQTSGLLDFFGDQIMAYLLISASSTSIPLTNNMREGEDNIFTDSSATSISMAFLAFATLSLSAMISGYKLSNQTYI